MLCHARPRLTFHGISHVSRRASSGDALKQHAFRNASKDAQTLPKRPLLHKISFWLRAVLIPGAVVYSVFYADWGEGDHVFMPPRKWLEEQKAAFFNLSPEERQLVEGDAQTEQSSQAANDLKKVSA
ncbi:hypothetical protein NEOLEDRAFT_1136526 [Neolentinus lepideus HHB14362 ss-1]|uniref:Uncharacterized protein n=1 Tax=Neolentinus lepideus HHB14362 ss-1 TaxID=1314782 RepID=A0A165R8T2_9AGAM|nr:hypothetical protein NEOLEDRAFT_1136526 [Neolentinus lepideus HHB14362 ss-1]